MVLTNTETQPSPPIYTIPWTESKKPIRSGILTVNHRKPMGAALTGKERKKGFIKYYQNMAALTEILINSSLHTAFYFIPANQNVLLSLHDAKIELPTGS